MANPKWQINGVTLPRNPTVFNIQHDTSNVTYVKMADGSQRRIIPPISLPGANITMEWQFADSRIQNATLALLNQGIMAASSSGAISKILLDGEAPAVELWAYLDSPTVQYSGHHAKSGNANDLIVDSRFGQGGVRKDIAIDGRTDGPYLHSHYPVPPGQVTINLAPNSDTLTGWTNAGTGAFSTGGPGGVADWEYTGTGSASGFYYVYSPVISVIPGQVYDFSAWIDPTQIASGSATLQLFNPARTVGYVTSLVSAGPIDRYSVKWTCPSDGSVTQIVAIFDTNQCTVANGQKLKFSQPMLTRAASANIVPNSDTMTGSMWQPYTLLGTANGGPGGAVDWEYNGTGVNATGSITGAVVIPVVPGATYTPSLWIDPSQIAHGTFSVSIWDINNNSSSLYSTNPIGGSQITIGQGPAQRYALPSFTVTQNVATNADTLTGWTATNMVIANGGPGYLSKGTGTSAAITGTGYPVASTTSLGRAINVTPGKTYTPSFWIDPSQLENNTGSQPNVGTQFPGATQNADGSWSNVDVKSSTTQYSFTSGIPFTVTGDIQKASTVHSAAILIGTTTNGYGITLDAGPNAYIVKFVNGVSTPIGTPLFSLINGNTPGFFHTMRITVIPGPSTTQLFGEVDGHLFSANDSSLNLLTGTWPILLQTGSSAGSIRNYSINPQVALSISTADQVQKIANTYVALNTTTLQRYGGPTWTCPTNLAPNSDNFSGWTLAGCSLGAGGPAGASDIEVSGTGSAQQFDVQSPAISVTPGQQYSISVWYDASCTFTYTGEQPRVLIYDITHGTECSDIYLTSGASGRFSVSFTIPAGCTSIRIQPHCQGNGLTIPSGKTLKFSQPMLELASSASGYYISSQTPQVYVSATLLPSAMVKDNLVANSDTFTGWTKNGTNLSVGAGGPSGATDIELVGTGSASGFADSYMSAAIPVTMGATYTPSCWVDPSQITAASMKFTLADSHFGTWYSQGSVNAGVAGRYNAPTWTCPTNLAPHSDDLAASAWTLVGGALGTGGPVGATDYEITGTGSASGFVYAQTAPISVTPGQTYTLSAWCDPSQITSGTAQIGICDVPETRSIVSANPAASGSAQRYAATAWTCPTNLCPNSDDFAGNWGISSSFTKTTGGPGGATDLEYTGTGVAIPGNIEADIKNIPVTPGVTYTPSMWVDPSQIANGYIVLRLMSGDDVTTDYEETHITVGAAGRYAMTPWTCPVGVTSIALSVLLWSGQSGGFVVANGQKIKFSQPMLEQAAAASGYYISSQNPQVRILFDSTNCTIANGQKLKFAQPMLEPTSNAAGYYISSQNPQVYLWFTPYNCTIANGQKIKWSQPMLEVGTAASATYYSGAQKFQFSQPMLEPSATAANYYLSDSNPQVQFYPDAWSGQSGGFIVNNGQKLKFSQFQLEAGTVANPYVSYYQSDPSGFSGFVASDIATWFGGPSGSNTIDGLPTWNGQPWNQIETSSGTITNTITNLGTAPWSPTIRLNGPFNSGLTLKVNYQDVDGTGQGVVFTYTGANVNTGDYLLFDTQKMRLTSSVAGAINEIYTFSVTTVANALPFPYWPPAPPGNFSYTVTFSGAGATTSFDYSNAGTETFRYWA